MLGYIIMLILSCTLAIWLMGIKGILLIISMVCFIIGLVNGTVLGVYGIILWIIWFIWMCGSGLSKPETRKEISKRTKAQKKEEEDWGIIDFSDKNK